MIRTLIAFPALLLATALPAAADLPKGFAERVETLRQQSGAPGIAIAVVHKGKVELAQGWGTTKLGGAQKVDADTIFQTGSTGKAFTAAALAILVDRGKIKWDDRVIDHMPWFRMYDPWVTREITIRDLLVHRSGLGLGAGDLLYVPRGSLSRKETVKRLAYIQPARSFRSGYAYDNILYSVAGQLIEEVSGKSWEDFMAQDVFAAGGMTSATANYETRLANPNRAHPHARIAGAVRGDGPVSMLDERAAELGRAALPAGGLALSANDLARWLQIQLGKGALPGGGRLFSAAQSAEMWKGVTLQPIAPMPGQLAPLTPNFNSYALGWSVTDYRGVRVIAHGGAVFGAIAYVILLPDQDVGIAGVVNAEETALLRGVIHTLVDHYLGAPDQDWPTRFNSFIEARITGAKAALSTTRAAPAKIGPSLSLDRYAGTYRDAWYGDVVVAKGKDGGLTIDFTTTPAMKGKLVHWQYDSFVTRFDDKSLEPAYVTFALDADGKVARVSMKPESPIADFSYNYQDLDLRPVGATK